MADEYDFIEKVNGEPYIEVNNSGEYISLQAIYDMHSQEKTVQDIADSFVISSEDVLNGINYWQNNPDVIDLLEGREEKKEEKTHLNESGPLDEAKRFFMDVLTDHSLQSTEIDADPEKKYFHESDSELHLNFHMKGKPVSVYTGVDGSGEGLVSFSADDEEGEVIIVDQDIRKKIREMYTSAVLEAKGL